MQFYVHLLSIHVLKRSTSTMPYSRPTVILIRMHRSRRRSRSCPAIRPASNMDPDCAICSAPATLQCECEANRLDIAVRQAEQRMMTGVFNEIRYALSIYNLRKASSLIGSGHVDLGCAPMRKTTYSPTSPCSPHAAKSTTLRTSSVLPTMPGATTASHHTLQKS